MVNLVKMGGCFRPEADSRRLLVHEDVADQVNADRENGEAEDETTCILGCWLLRKSN